MSRKLVMPDYKNCIANIPNSILKSFGVETVGDTLPLVDKYLEKEYRNVVLLLLDGMGQKLLESHLDANGAFRSNLVGTTQSVFLSTTVAATTSAITGLQPCEHSWLGWDCYFPQIDKNVTVFRNTIQGTEELVADFHVANTFNPYKGVVERLREAGKAAFYSFEYMPPYLKSMEEICENIKRLCKEPEKKYIYAYWNQPDGLLHRHGCRSAEVHENLLSLEKVVSEMAAELEDTLLIVTADHGHIDNECVNITNYPGICECLDKKPSLEPRVINFFVKRDKEEVFVNEFNKEFGDKFLLMIMDEAIEKNMFGTGKHHKNFRGMLGNYIAIATDNLSIYFDDEVWVSMHGSLTEDEMIIPVIIFDSCK